MISRPYIIYVRLKEQQTPVVFEATALPGTNEKLSDWINREIALLDEELDPANGMLYLEEDEVTAITFIKKGTGGVGGAVA